MLTLNRIFSQPHYTTGDDSIVKLTGRTRINITASLTTMARDSAPPRYDLRSRPSTSSSQAVARSTAQQKSYSHPRRALVKLKVSPTALLKLKANATASTLPSLSIPQVTRVPYLPPEVVANILSYYCIHEEPVTLLPPHETIDWQEGFDEHKPLPFARFAPKTPFQSHKAPMINLLLTNKQFHDEVIKQFYRRNTFTFLHGDHDEVWINTNGAKRTLVRHIQLESLWELDMIFSQDKTKPQEVEAVFTVKPVWGRDRGPPGVPRYPYRVSQSSIYHPKDSSQVQQRQ